MTTMDAYDPTEAMEYDRMAQQDDARGPVPCRVCGNDPCTCGHHEEPRCGCLWAEHEPHTVAEHTSCGGQSASGPPCGVCHRCESARTWYHAERLQRLADEQWEAGEYLARGGDRIAACDWCGQHTCDQRDDHRRLNAQREQTWRER